MIHVSVESYLSSTAAKRLAPGPVAVILCDGLGSGAVSGESARARGATGGLVFLGSSHWPEAAGDPGIAAIEANVSKPALRAEALNRLIDGLAGRWVLVLQAGERFFFPYCETRSIDDLIGFLTSERRQALYSYELDLYHSNLPEPEREDKVGTLYLDRRGHFAFPHDEGILDSFGGLSWRFEEFFGDAPEPIGRAVLFRAKKGVHLSDTLGFADPAYRSVACPWHHNPTGAVVSLRRARRLFAQAGFGAVRDKLLWQGSVEFDWTSRQLLELGLIEPGQWF